MTTETPPRLLTVEEAATLYRVSTKTIRRWIAAGRLTSIRPGGRTVRVVVPVDVESLTTKPEMSTAP